MHWSRSYLTWVCLLIVLAVTSFCVLQTTIDTDSIRQTSKASPDIRATDICLIATSDSGQMRYTVNAKRLLHYNAHQHSTFDQPKIIITQQPDRPNWIITADFGEAFDGTEKVFLKDNVKAKQDSTVILTDYIWVNQTNDSAETNAHVSIITPENQVEADGLHALLQAKRVTLLHNVRGLYVPKSID